MSTVQSRPALPKFTAEQTAQHLAAAKASREAKSALVKSVKTDTVSNLRKIFELANTKSPVVKRLKVKRVLRNIPGVGEKTAIKFLDKASISHERSIAALSSRQQDALLAVVDSFITAKQA